MDAVVFLDTETTGRDRLRRAWEIAMIRRDDFGEREVTLFVDVADLALHQADPQALAIGRFDDRHPQRRGKLSDNQYLMCGAEAAAVVHEWTADARVFGVVPSFDTGCLDSLLERHGRTPKWHFQPWDIAVLATGYLIGRQQPVERSAEATSRACGVDIPVSAERHTALGDARWVRRLYDRIFTRVEASAAA
ncbi:hypothetical protein E3G68_005030 [Mycobacteroides abscessus]|uniref:3'-5' exoribonuclease n=1 Tax=Mycobacteroides abscessus TaxID=36809 RepID=UPI001C655DD1|nr:hypothetical protein [Mycobacteroides abscessus]